MITKRKYPWFAKQNWKHIFFLHWHIDPKLIIPHLPSPLKVDTYNNFAWITVVCFVAKNSRLRYMPIYFVKEAIQINVRTYVKVDGYQERGVYFFRLLINHKLATQGAKNVFGLPFHFTQSSINQCNKMYQYSTYGDNDINLNVHLQRSTEYDQSNLAQFLTERYCIWNMKGNRLIKVPIIHSKWKLYKAKSLNLQQNVHPLIKGKNPYSVHFAYEKMANLYPFETVAKYP